MTEQKYPRPEVGQTLWAVSQGISAFQFASNRVARAATKQLVLERREITLTMSYSLIFDIDRYCAGESPWQPTQEAAKAWAKEYLEQVVEGRKKQLANAQSECLALSKLELHQ